MSRIIVNTSQHVINHMRCQVMAVFVSFIILIKLVAPDWKEVFYGLVPSKVRLFLCPSN